MSDPFGLTAEQRMESDLAAYMDDLVSGRVYARNLKLIQDLPDGTMIRIMDGPPMTKEQVLATCF